MQPVSVFVLERNGAKPAPEAGRREMSHFSARGAFRSGLPNICAEVMFEQRQPLHAGGILPSSTRLVTRSYGSAARTDVRVLVVWGFFAHVWGWVGGAFIIGHALVDSCSRYDYQNV